MDAWNPDQLKRMQAGGNAKLNTFLEQYGVSKHTDIKEKYNSKGAEFYREKIRAEVDGRSYLPPAPSEVLVPLPRPKSYAGPRTSSSAGWDTWDNDASSPVHAASANNLSSNSGKSEYTMSQLEASASRKEDFFARKMVENAGRPENLPPSQGGKYVGFGSTPAPAPRQSAPQNIDDVSELFSRGLSGLGALAGQAAEVAKQRAADVNAHLKDSGVTDTLGQATSTAAEKTKEYGSKGWSLLKTAYAAAASTIETTAAHQGIKVDLGSKKVAESARFGGTSSASYGRIEGPAPDGYDGLGGGYDGWGGGGSGAHYNRSNGNGVPSRSGNNLKTSNCNFSGFGGDTEDQQNGWASRAPLETKTVSHNATRTGNVTVPGEWTGREDGGAVSPTTPAPKDDDWGKW